MAEIHEVIPDPEVLLELEPEELAGPLLRCLNSLEEGERGLLNRYNYSLPNTVREYPPQHRERISEALMEAWVWLEREGLLAPKPGSQGEFVFITRRGKQLQTEEDFQTLRQGLLLPRELLHPVILQKSWSPFLRGEYDTAVFQAFKQVEIATRAAGAYGERDYGTDLMRRAFNVDNGPLSDSSAPEAERQGLSDLFAGAIGLYKNPHSHRDVPLQARDAVELIVLASHLMNVLEAKSQS